MTTHKTTYEVVHAKVARNGSVMAQWTNTEYFETTDAAHDFTQYGTVIYQEPRSTQILAHNCPVTGIKLVATFVRLWSIPLEVPSAPVFNITVSVENDAARCKAISNLHQLGYSFMGNFCKDDSLAFALVAGVTQKYFHPDSCHIVHLVITN